MLEPPPLPPPSTEDPAPTPHCEWMVMPAIMLRIVASTRGGIRLVAKAEVAGVELEACDLGDMAVLVVVALVPELDGDALKGFQARPRNTPMVIPPR